VWRCEELCAGAGGGVEPLKPIVETRPAAHMAAIVSARIRRGVSQGIGWLCIQVRNPLAAEAAAIAQPAHMRPRIVRAHGTPRRLRTGLQAAGAAGLLP